MIGSVIGKLRILIGGDSKDLDKLLAQTGKGLASFGNKLEKAAFAGIAAAGAAAAASLVALTVSSMSTIDAQSKLAHRLADTVENVQTLQYAADLAGVPVEALATSSGKLNQRLAEAARTGAGPAHDALRRLGLEAGKLLQMGTADRLATIADRMTELGYTTAQQADVLRQFGVRGQELLSLFEEGGDAIRAAAKDVRDFGVATSRIDAVKIEQANDAWTTARLVLTGIGNQLAVTLAPVIKDVADRFVAAARESGGFGEVIRSVVRRAFVGFGDLLGAIYDMRLGWASFVEGFTRSMTTGVVNYLRLAAIVITKTWIPPLATAGDHVAQIKERLGERPTGEAWGAFFDDIQTRATESAQKVAVARDKMLGKGGPALDPLSDDQRKKLDEKLAALRASLASEDLALAEHRDKELRQVREFEAQKIATRAEAAGLRMQIEDKFQRELNELIWSRLEEGVAGEDEILARKHQKQLDDLAKFEGNRTVTETRASELRRKLAEKHALDLVQLQARQYSSLANIVDSAMSNISSVIGQEGGAAFQIMKAISQATALVKGYEAVVSAYAAGSAVGGPPVGAAFAAIAAAGVAAQIAALQAVQPNGAGGTPAPMPSAGATSAAAATGQPAAGSGQTLYVRGLDPKGWYSGLAMRDLAEALIDYQKNGGTIVLGR